MFPFRFFRPLAQTFCAFGAGLFLSCSDADLLGEDSDRGTTTVEFLDAGQALSVLISENSHAQNFLYDAGKDSSGIWDSLKARKISHLDWALASHWHRDHAGGFLEWDSSTQIDTFFYGPDLGNAWLRDSVLKLAEKFGSVPVQISRGKRLGCGEFRCQILWPTDYGAWKENNASLVLQISDDSLNVLFAGDLEREGEENLIRISENLRAELLQVGHHGSKNSSSLRFLESVFPKYAVISVGRKNSYGHPAAETLERLELVLGDSAQIFRTDKLGSIRFDWKFGKGLWPGNF